MDLSTNTEEGRSNVRALSFGGGIGIIVGAVLTAITGNPAWIAIGLPFGAAFGIAFRTLSQRTDR